MTDPRIRPKGNRSRYVNSANPRSSWLKDEPIIREELHRQVLALHREQLSHNEIALRTGLSSRTVQRWLAAAREEQAAS